MISEETRVYKHSGLQLYTTKEALVEPLDGKWNKLQAYDLLQIISKDEKSRIIFEAKQPEISDQLTRRKSAEIKKDSR